MDAEIERRIDERRAELRQSLRQAFGDETENAVAMLIAAFRRTYDDPAKQIDRALVLAALDQLPKGSSASPRGQLNMVGDRFGVIFSEAGQSRYYSSKTFATADEADQYASNFQMRLREHTL